MNFTICIWFLAFCWVGLQPAAAQGTKSLGTSTSVNTPQGNGVSTWLHGKWEGIGYQTDNGSTWEIEVTAYMEGNKVKIDYPSIPCGGIWELKYADDCRAEFLEVITYGKNRCRDYGKLVITYVDANHVSYTYFATDGTTPTLNGHSTLFRVNM